MPFTAFDRRLGATQGRIAPTGHTTVDGTHAFVLGSDAPGQIARLAPGDSIAVSQTADFDDALAVRLVGAVRLPATMPAGFSWALDLRTDDTTRCTIALESGVYDPAVLDLGDVALNVEQAAAGNHALAIRLRLVGPGIDPVDVELPALYLDAVAFDTNPGDLYLSCRLPSPAQTDVPSDLPSLQLVVASTTGSDVDSTTLVLRVGPAGGLQLAYDGGAGGWQAPFTGDVATVGVGSADQQVRIDLAAASFHPFTHLQTVQVRAQAETLAGDAIDSSYSFTIEDLQAPQLTSAIAIGRRTVRLTFNEPMTSPIPAASFAFSSTAIPHMPVHATSVVDVTGSVFDVELDAEMSMRATYRVTVSGATDLNGNVIDGAIAALDFPGYACADAGRFMLIDLIPMMNRREDVTGDLDRFFAALQDTFDHILCDIDDWTSILDIDGMAPRFVEAWLQNLGNPFAFAVELDDIDRRRLLDVLVDMYRQKGTAAGIINVVRFFMGIEIEIDTVNDDEFWEIGVDELGVGTLLGPGAGSPLWYSFRIVSPIDLTDVEEARIVAIADYMKPAHEHILDVVEPSDPVDDEQLWELGESELGTETMLGT